MHEDLHKGRKKMMALMIYKPHQWGCAGPSGALVTQK